MNKIILFASICLFYSVSLLAQEMKLDVKFGDEVKDALRLDFDLMGYDNGKVYVMKSKGGLFSRRLNKFSIDRLDDSYNVEASNEIDLKEKGKKLNLEFVFQSGSNIYLFTSFHNQKTMSKYLFAQTIDKNTLKRSEDIRKIAEVPYNNKYLSGWFGYEFSPDSSYIMVFAKTQARKRDPEIFDFHVFDQNMEQQWERKVRLNDTEERLFVIDDYELDNWGNVFMMAKEYRDKPKERRRGKVNYKYTILSYHGPKAPVREYSVSLGDKYLTDMNIEVDHRGNIVCGGFFSNKGSWSIRGTYFLTINGETGNVDKSSEKIFDIDFITQNMKPRKEMKVKKREAKGKEVELYEYDLDELILRRDGSATLVAEQYFVRVVTSFTSGPNGTQSSRTDYHYYYNDIIVVDIGKSGKIMWAQKVPKAQHSVNDNGYYSSYALALIGTDLYFVYNDTRKNYEGKYPEKIYNFSLRDKKGIVSVVKVDKEGNLERQSLFSNKEIETVIRPKLSLQFTRNEMLLFGKRGRKNQFGRVKFL